MKIKKSLRTDLIKNELAIKESLPTDLIKNKLPIKGHLLEDFVKEKIDNYEEPTRRGTRLGERIGFSRKKFAATLWLLTNTNTKDIARTVRVSEALLRKWKIEDTFKEKIAQNEIEFAKYHWQYIKKLYTENRWDVLLDDYSQYSHNLLLLIHKNMYNNLKRIGRDAEVFFQHFWHNVFLLTYPGRLVVNTWGSHILQLTIESSYNTIEGILKESSLSEKDGFDTMDLLLGLKALHSGIIKEALTQR